MNARTGWIGVDLDGTLARYDSWRGPGHIGVPILPMVARVKAWLDEGRDVRIFTARCFPFVEPITPGMSLYRAGRLGASEDAILNAGKSIEAIQDWCQLHLGRELTITCCKDFQMVELWDDRCRQVVTNTGEPVDVLVLQ